VDPRADQVSHPKLQEFEESKGILSISACPTAIIVARTQGNISVIDLGTRNNYSIDVDASRTGSANKLLRVQALPNDQILVLTTDTMAVYAMPNPQQPHVFSPTFIRSLPRSVSGWVHDDTASSPSTAPIHATSISILTENGQAVRYSLLMPADEGSWDLIVEAQEEFPYPVERLTLTEMHGGGRRCIWVHWRRGFEDWPVHVLGSHRDSTPTEDVEEEEDHGKNAETGACSLAGLITASGFNFRSLAAVNSEAPSTPPTAETALATQVWTCTRSVSMPRICFDEAGGRVFVAGTNAAVIAICDYA